MGADLRRLVLLFTAIAITACTGAPKREPQAVTAEYNPERVRLLKLAADDGLLFQVSESVIRDLPVRSVGDRCRRADEGEWISKIYSTLEIMDRDRSQLGKVHFVEFRRGDRAGAEISKDLDGATALVLSYAKVERRETIETLAQIPCGDGDMSLVGREMTVTSFEWPAESTVAGVLGEAGPRPAVERFDIDRRFPQWLAERMAIFRLTPEIAFEKTPTGQPLLVTAMRRLSEEVTTERAQPALDYWLKEITKRSHLGAGIKFFGLNRDLQLSTGLQVDSAGKFARKMNGYSDPTYPFVSYKVENGSYVTGSLRELGSCLSDFMGTYRSPLSSMATYDMDPDSFLFPGHSCQARATE